MLDKHDSARLYNGVEIPLVGLGTWTIHGEALDIAVSSALNCGYRMFDTATLYQNESELGEILKTETPREKIFLVSKVNPSQFMGRRRYLYLNRKSLRQCYRQTLKRLRTDYLDMYMLHDGTNDYVRRYKELVNLYERGEVRSIGVCNVDMKILDEMIQTTGVPPHVVQCQMHPLFTKKRLLNFCRDHSIVFEAHSQFALNDSKLLNNPVLESIALKYSKSVRQIILRWLIQQNVIVIPRSSNPKNIKSNIEIFDFSLNEEEMDRIDGLNEDYSVKGYDKPSIWV